MIKIYKRKKGFAVGNLQQIFYKVYEFDFGFWFIQIDLNKK